MQNIIFHIHDIQDGKASNKIPVPGEPDIRTRTSKSETTSQDITKTSGDTAQTHGPPRTVYLSFVHLLEPQEDMWS